MWGHLKDAKFPICIIDSDDNWCCMWPADKEFQSWIMGLMRCKNHWFVAVLGVLIFRQRYHTGCFPQLWYSPQLQTQVDQMFDNPHSSSAQDLRSLEWVQSGPASYLPELIWCLKYYEVQGGLCGKRVWMRGVACDVGQYSLCIWYSDPFQLVAMFPRSSTVRLGMVRPGQTSISIASHTLT